MFREKYKKALKENYKNRFNRYKRFNRNKFNYFKSLFGSFKPNILHDFYTFAHIVLENEVDLKDFIEFVKIVKDIQKEQILIKEKTESNYIESKMKEMEEKIPKCPKCNSPLYVKNLNNLKGKSNLYKWKTYMTCTNDDCLYEKFLKEEIKEIDYNFTINYDIDNVSDIVDPDIDNLFGININDTKNKGK